MCWCSAFTYWPWNFIRKSSKSGKESAKEILEVFLLLFLWKEKVTIWSANILPRNQNTVEKFRPINLSGHNFFSMCQSISIDITFDKMIQSKVFRKQFQSSLINMLKWFRSDGRNKTKTRKDSKAILAFNFNISIYRFFYAKCEREKAEGAERMELLLKIYPFNMFALNIL